MSATIQSLESRRVAAGQSVCMDGISWVFYEAFLSELGERSAHRLSYDRGELHIMSPSPEHEAYARILGRVFEALADELRLPYKCLGSVTCRREDLERGLEPDNCFYIRNVQAVLGRRRFELRRDPPPDLAMEVDITESSVDRRSIYAALGVPEIWLFDGAALTFYQLREQSEYEATARSGTFPFLEAEEALPLIHAGFETDDMNFKVALRAWASARIAAASGG